MTTHTSPAGSEAQYQVTGMTCGHCAQAVQDEIAALDGVRAVRVDLVAGATSTVVITADPQPDAAAVAAALAEAGDYHLA